MCNSLLCKHAHIEHARGILKNKSRCLVSNISASRTLKSAYVCAFLKCVRNSDFHVHLHILAKPYWRARARAASLLPEAQRACESLWFFRYMSLILSGFCRYLGAVVPPVPPKGMGGVGMSLVMHMRYSITCVTAAFLDLIGSLCWFQANKTGQGIGVASKIMGTAKVHGPSSHLCTLESVL